MTSETIETLIIGGGQAGLAMSQQLSKRARPHLVLERGRVAERWRSERWDGLHFQTPNPLVTLPDFPLPHDDPGGFATRDEIVAYLAAYADFIAAPIRERTEVTALRQEHDGFVAETAAGSIHARNVVVATGPFQTANIPPVVPDSPDLTQLHARDYRAPGQLPAGAVLVVGAGASGSQIAQELLKAGRRVYLSVSKHRRAPRRYRGHDHIWWWLETGMDKTPPERRPADRSPLVHTGAYGGQSIDFRDFARQGMGLLGHVTGFQDGAVTFAPDLLDNLAHGDAGYHAFMDFVDAHIARTGMDLPPDPAARAISPTPPWLADAPTRLDLRANGITSIVWCTGYGIDFRWIGIPVFDPRGLPMHKLGITAVRGLYFLGLPFLAKMSSSFLFGVGEDAERLANHIAGESS